MFFSAYTSKQAASYLKTFVHVQILTIFKLQGVSRKMGLLMILWKEENAYIPPDSFRETLFN